MYIFFLLWYSFFMADISLENKTVLVTGAAGFIGSFLSKRLLETYKGITVIGID
ncbi:NAD-dependent epimerase/dehydratase family protein, partial [Treponema porcinum]|uniref:NAD-dependent epimerase/dehydratase family protein n=1 Tax=Treponema porcinum TaxID=261392 RepID=UPI002A8387D5